MLSEHATTEYKKLAESAGRLLSDDEAMEEAENLLRLFSLIYREVKKGWYESN